MDWLTRPQCGASPWLPQRVRSKEGKIGLVVRSINVEGTSNFIVGDPGLDFRLRLQAFAELFRSDWPFSIGVIGVQQTKTDLTNCPFAPEVDNGTRCFSRAIQREYSSLGAASRTAAAVGSTVKEIELGVIAGGDWVIEGNVSWAIGKDVLAAEWLTQWFGKTGGSRYLQEVALRHLEKGWRLRFYSTHLSHNAGDRNHDDERRSQIENIKRTVKSQALPGELPPIVVGDFNFGANHAKNTMSSDFSLAHEAYESEIDQIWVGNLAAFPQARGTLSKVGVTTLKLKGESRYGAHQFSRLSAHNSPGVAFRVLP